MWTMTNHSSPVEDGIQPFTNNYKKMWRITIFHENQIFNILLSTDNWPAFSLQDDEIFWGIHCIAKELLFNDPVINLFFFKHVLPPLSK